MEDEPKLKPNFTRQQTVTPLSPVDTRTSALLYCEKLSKVISKKEKKKKHGCTKLSSEIDLVRRHADRTYMTNRLQCCPDFPVKSEENFKIYRTELKVLLPDGTYEDLGFAIKSIKLHEKEYHYIYTVKSNKVAAQMHLQPYDEIIKVGELDAASLNHLAVCQNLTQMEGDKMKIEMLIDRTTFDMDSLRLLYKRLYMMAVVVIEEDNILMVVKGLEEVMKTIVISVPGGCEIDIIKQGEKRKNSYYLQNQRVGLFLRQKDDGSLGIGPLFKQDYNYIFEVSECAGRENEKEKLLFLWIIKTKEHGRYLEVSKNKSIHLECSGAKKSLRISHSTEAEGWMFVTRRLSHMKHIYVIESLFQPDHYIACTLQGIIQLKEMPKYNPDDLKIIKQFKNDKEIQFRIHYISDPSMGNIFKRQQYAFKTDSGYGEHRGDSSSDSDDNGGARDSSSSSEDQADRADNSSSSSSSDDD